MNNQLHLTLLALALCGAWGSAQATDTAQHNDMDGDGRSDLIWGNAGTGAIVYWSGARASAPVKVLVDKLAYNVGGTFDPHRIRTVLAYSGAFYPSRSVLQVRDASTGYDFTLFPHDGSSGYVAYNQAVGTPDWLAVGAGDFDGNGSADLFYRNLRDGRNLTLNDAAWGDWSGIYPATTVATLTWKVAGVGDFDADGRADVLWRNGSTGTNVLWRSGSAATQQAVTAVRNLDWQIATVGDFNGDGRSDILWRNARTGANVIWKSGNSQTPQAITGVTNLAWKVAATGDFNGDGKWDVVWRNATTGANVIWLSANAATPLRLTAVTNQAWKIVP